MGLLLVNSGRAASRFVHLMVRAQPDVVTVPRHELDAAMTAWITSTGSGMSSIARSRAANPRALWNSIRSVGLHGLLRGLRRLMSSSEPHPLLRQLDAVQPWVDGAIGDGPELVLTMHGARPRLAHPFDSDVNHRFLSDLRDSADIDTCVLVMRNVDEVLRSEWNRERARVMGDWTFTGAAGWRPRWTLADLASLSDRSVLPASQPRPIPQDVEAAARRMAVRTGRHFELWKLFSTVFPRTHVLPYQLLVNEPSRAFDELTRISGVNFPDRGLAHVRVNGLMNRFLTYNPVDLTVDGVGRIRYSFDIPRVLELDDDWGDRQPIDVDCTDVLRPVADQLSQPIGIGAHTSDLAALDTPGRRLLTSPSFVRSLVEQIGPAFSRSVSYHDRLYREHVYVEAVPEAARRVFTELLADDRESMEQVLSDDAATLGR